jgi:flagellar hook-length control protein FliK
MSNEVSTRISEPIPSRTSQLRKSVGTVRDHENLSFFSELLTSIQSTQESSLSPTAQLDDYARAERSTDSQNRTDPSSDPIESDRDDEERDPVESEQNDQGYTDYQNCIPSECYAPKPSLDHKAEDHSTHLRLNQDDASKVGEHVDADSEAEKATEGAVLAATGPDPGATTARKAIKKTDDDREQGSIADAKSLHDKNEFKLNRDSKNADALEKDRTAADITPSNPAVAPNKGRNLSANERRRSTSANAESSNAIQEGTHEASANIESTEGTKVNGQGRSRRSQSRAGRGQESTQSDEKGNESANQNLSSVSTALAAVHESMDNPDVALTATTPLDATTSFLSSLSSGLVDTTTVSSSIEGPPSSETEKKLATDSKEARSITSVNAPTSSVEVEAPSASSESRSIENTRAPSSTGSGRSTSISPYQETKLVQRVLRGFEQIGESGGQVRLRLHPPELGALQMTIRIESGQMFAKLEVENAVAREALLNNVQVLKDRLADQGMQVESFEVQINSDTSGSGGNTNLAEQDRSDSQSRWDTTNSRYAMMNSNRLSAVDPNAERESPGRWVRNHGSLDLTV